MNLPEFSVQRPVTALMVFVAAIMIGMVCLWQIPVDSLPEMELPTISVITKYKGAAPEDVEKKVTKVLERFLGTVSDLKHISSRSKEETSIISLSFEWGTDLDTRSNEVRDSVGMAKMRLPDDIDEPRVVKIDISQWPIMVFGVSANESYSSLGTLLEDEVADPLKRLPGVGSAGVMVPLNRQINVDIDRERLAAYGLTPQDVVRAIARENVDTPAGNVKVGLTDYLVRVPGEFDNVADMRRIVLASRDRGIIRLADVGDVEDGFAEIRRYITVNGARGGIIMIQKQSDANTVEVARAVTARMKELQKRLPRDVRIIKVMDASEDIERMIADLSDTLLFGGILAMMMVLVFLRQWRATLIIGLTIPFSLILAIICIYFMGLTINMMSLFGMIIAVGMIVDNAIVILENITRHREEGERPREGAVYGSSEVSMAIIASSLTTVCIFFPILFVKGITKIFFSEFALVVIVVMAGSLFSALTLTPMLSSILMKRFDFSSVSRNRFFRTTEKIFDRITIGYGVLLEWALHHRKIVITTAVVVFGGSLMLIPLLGSEFMPEEDAAVVRGTLHLPVGTRVEETAKMMMVLDRIIGEEVPAGERVNIYTRCGTSGSGMSSIFGTEGSHIGTFGVKLVPRVERSRSSSEVATAVRSRLELLSGALGIQKFDVGGGNPMAGLFLGGEKPLTVNIIGDDMEVTDRLAARIKGIVQKTPGTINVSVSREKGRPELWVNVDRDKASAIGFNVSAVGDTIRASFYGRVASKYRVHGDEYDIFVRLREKDRGDIQALAATPLGLPTGGLVRTENIAKTSMEYGPVEIQRKDQGRIVNVLGDVYGRSLGEVVQDIEKELAGIEIPQGVEIIMAGQTTEQRESFFWLTLSLIVGIVLVYLVMASQFESLLDPFVIMFSVPFAFTGAIWAIFLGGHALSIVVFLGLLMLVGIVVNNAIVLVDYINILRAREIELFEAVSQACQTRLRPVLMTAMTTIMALLPMAFGRGQGAEVWNPIGLTVLGGLLVSTLVTLVLVPTVYTILETHLKKNGTE